MTASNPEFLGKSQYQIDDIVFGRDTNMPVSKVEIQPWNVNNEDFQIIHSDETRFGIDNLTPAPIVFTMAVLNNWALENMPASAGGPVPPGLLYQARTLLGKLSNAWKATSTRQTWGAMKMILFVDTDGVRRRVYGRPGKFQHGPVEKNEWVDVQAEFRRADTFAYKDNEMVIEVGFNTDPTVIHRTEGDAPAWFRVLFYGPLTDPTVTVGKLTIELDLDIPSNAIVEVSSYPWMRRIVDSNGLNWRAALIGSSQYLDQLQIPPDEDVVLRWTDHTLSTWTSLDSNVQPTNFDFLDMFNLGVTGAWHTLLGVPIWGYSIPNGGYLFAPFGTCAIIDELHTYQTSSQFIQTTIADVWRGATTVCFKADNALANFAGFQIVKAMGISEIIGGSTDQDRLRLVTGGLGTAYNILYEYDVPAPGLHSGNTVAAAYDSNTDLMYLYLNGVEISPANGVSCGGFLTGDDSHQGFVLNMEDGVGGQITFGVGLNNTIGYDITFTEPPDGTNTDLSSRIFLYWREAWNIE